MIEPSKVLKLIFPTFEAAIEIKRHFSPSIYTNLLVRIPLTTFAYPSRGDLLVKVNIKRGEVWKIPTLSVGDVYYDIIEDALGITLQSKNPCSKSQIKVGSVVEGIEELGKVSRLTPVKITTG